MMEQQSTKRLQSIDALRGFDMLWIMGAPACIAALNALFGGRALEWCNTQMEHVPWNGFHWMDLVFPLFLFIAGVSFPFSLDKRRAKQESEKHIYRHLIKRAVTLVLLGLLYNGILKFPFETARFASVLAHIGLAWLLGAILFMNTRKTFARSLWIVGILLGYGLLNAFVLSPNAVGTNPFVPENNIVAQVDRWFLPGNLYNGNFDPEGILSLIPAVATALMGMISGDFLKSGRLNPSQKTGLLLLTGIVLILLSMLLSPFIPINKALWSSSFALLTGGISLVLLSMFFWIIDVRGYTRWAFFFRVIGLNSITIYIGQSLINFWDISSLFLGSISLLMPVAARNLLIACGYVAACWLFLYLLYKKNIFIHI
jgi:predicted acyltransferase